MLPRAARPIVVLLAILILLGVPSAGAQDERLCFPNVSGISNCIEGRFREYWLQNGGLPVFGYPISPAAMQQTAEGTFLTQYFERNRFELHPEQQRPYDVLLGRLGDERLTQQGRDWRTLSKADASQPHFFADTGHAIAHPPFWQYWSTHGLAFDDNGGNLEGASLALFGLPLSEPAVETNANGDTVLTQWFERARFEDHGAAGVLLGLLGVETGGSAPPAEGAPDPPSPAPTDDAAYAAYLRANFSQLGPYRLQLDKVSIVNWEADHHGVYFEMTRDDVAWVVDNARTADMEEWGRRALEEVKSHWPNQTVSAFLSRMYYADARAEANDCLYAGQFVAGAGWYHIADFIQTQYSPGAYESVKLCIPGKP